MRTIEMRQDNILTGIGHSSKGNQMKWKQDGYWYKADQFGYESLSEVVTSRLLEASNIMDVTIYNPIAIQYKENMFRGCYSKDFRKSEELLVPIERLFKNYTSIGLAKQIARITDVKERIKYVEEIVYNVTRIEDFSVYITKILEMDAFFLNEDRHTNNISLLYDKNADEYRLCPFYDMGLSLFSDTRIEFPLHMDYFTCKEKITAKPFARDFDEQLDAANELYGCHLKFNFPANKITDIIKDLKEDCLLTEVDIAKGRVDGYTEQEFKRVEDTLRYQSSKYKYMFQE